MVDIQCVYNGRADYYYPGDRLCIRTSSYPCKVLGGADRKDTQSFHSIISHYIHHVEYWCDLCIPDLCSNPM